MNTKEYLSQVYCKERRIKEMVKELNSYRALADSISSPLLGEKIQSTRNVEPSFVKCISEISEIEQKVQTEHTELLKLKSEIETQISKLPNLNQRLVLRYRHLMCYSWAKIADEMQYSVRWVLKIYSQALNNFEKIKIGHPSSL